MFTKTEIELAPKTIEAIKKISKAKGKDWEWKPEVGDWIVEKETKQVGIITEYSKKLQEVCYMLLDKNKKFPPGTEVIGCPVEDIMSLYHWEKLEKIMNSLGYYLTLEPVDIYNSGFRAVFWEKLSEEDELPNSPVCKTRQEAVMRAIIKLGEEIGNED